MSKVRRLARTLKSVKPGERINPKSIRRLLHQWISAQFDRDVEAAAAALNASRPPPGTKASRRICIDRNTFYDIVNDTTLMKYHQVEAVARHHNVPIAALLLFTRAQSELENGAHAGFDRATELMQRFQAFAQGLSSLIAEASLNPAPELEDRSAFLDYAAFQRLTEHFEDEEKS